MHDKMPSERVYDPSGSLRELTGAKPAENAALLPALNDPYKAARFR